MPSTSKNIVVYIDGTGNKSDEQRPGRSPSNIHRLYELTIENTKQVSKYFKGVATSEWKVWNAKGGFSGLGGNSKKRKAYKYLENTYSSGDKIFLIGFSRGAAIVRDLANHIERKGIKGEKNVQIEAVGLFDTVAAFGIPVDIIGFNFQETNLGKELDLPNIVKYAYHLLAIDEQRDPFIPTLINAREGFEEVWFAGVHSDIGGGYADRKLADITLRYMACRLAESHGVLFDENRISQIDENLAGKGDPADNDDKHHGLKLGLRTLTMKRNDKLSDEAVTIHLSVARKMQGSDYYPKNVVKLNGGYKVVDNRGVEVSGLL